MREDLLILDKNDTLMGSGELYDGVREFLDFNGVENRDMILATLDTTKKAEIEMMLSLIKDKFIAILGREVTHQDIFKPWQYVFDPIIGKTIFDQLDPRKQDHYLSLGLKVEPYDWYKVGRVEELSGFDRDKNLDIVERVYRSLKGEDPRDTKSVNSIFIGNEQDALFADSKKEIPMLIVKPGGGWLESGYGKVFTECLFAERRSFEAFDILHRQGESTGSISTYLKPLMQERVIKDECRKVTLGENTYIFARTHISDNVIVDGVRLAYPASEIKRINY